jgi:hypothetical protein
LESVIFLRHILASVILITVVLLAEVVQWLILAWSTGPIWVDIAWRRKKSHLPKRCDFYILSKTMDQVQKTSGSQCYIPSSEPFRIQTNKTCCIWRKFMISEGIVQRY